MMLDEELVASLKNSELPYREEALLLKEGEVVRTTNQADINFCDLPWIPIKCAKIIRIENSSRSYPLAHVMSNNKEETSISTYWLEKVTDLTVVAVEEL
jgi:hypothetical protein